MADRPRFAGRRTVRDPGSAPAGAVTIRRLTATQGSPNTDCAGRSRDVRRRRAAPGSRRHLFPARTFPETETVR